MSLRNYLKSKVFFTQLFIVFAIFATLGYLFMHWLTFTTQHGNEITVPDLSKLSEQQVEERLDELNLDYVLLDSVDYKKDYPKHSVVDQDPVAGAKVKEGRKIYIKINSSGFTTVRVPDLIEKTYRQAVPTLKSLGLEEGTITYKPYLGKDMVLEMHLNGKKLNPGDKVFKSSKIDLVLGDGNVGFDDTQLDSLATPETPVNAQ
ncbi:PASTA domain-containing protein [Flavobacterium psychrotolerans]|uniref:PASTA domain-containing protein n=1 Tax=Flavobacterium psychrotolerans TaxID=2169410 RepID=A0A2U1JHB3_9FLAO|nr:PASTA domain-containing protein [Flavobacterium psychrotolerans]PWA04253.1 PASTA domain-containing protein [Flavobacterium psychrotolerans]